MTYFSRTSVQRFYHKTLLPFFCRLIAEWNRIKAIRGAGFAVKALALAAACMLFLVLLLPRPLFDTPYSKVVYSSDGELLGAKIASDQQWRFPYSKDVPEKYKAALLQFEDKRFYFHPGIDPLALVRAIAANLKQGKIVSGASTISMQVVRLSQNKPERGWRQKIYESLLTVGLELRYSKKEILAFYCCHAPYGGNIVGIHAASWRYFGRNPEDLSWAESALLAILPNNPALVHPGRNRDALKLKRDALLQRLYEKGRLSALDLELAKSEPLPQRPHPLPRIAPHLLETLSRYEKSKSTIISTIDMTIQERCNEIVQKHYESYTQRGIYNIAAIVIDNESLEVVAYVGNIPRPNSVRGHSLFADHGYDIDLIRSPRSTGSILKPLLYAAMLNEGSISPEMLVRDVPLHFDGFMPQNYDRSFSGVVRAKEALARSLNIPSVLMLRDYGYQRFYTLLKSAGITTLFRPADDYGLALIIGGAEGTLWEISSAYCALARRVTDSESRVPSALKKEKNVPLRMKNISPGAAYLTLEALLDVQRPGIDNYWRSFAHAQKIAWKTGTSIGHRDAWAVGLTQKYTVGVWVGNADGEGKPEMTGLTTAAPVLFALFNTLPRSSWFSPPYQDLKTITVCAKSGYLATDLCESVDIQMPRSANFEKLCPYHTLIHTDQSGLFRVTGECCPESEMRHIPYFVLPPVEEFYYIMSGAQYKRLPPFRNDCQHFSDDEKRTPMSIIYPAAGTEVYVPVDISGEKSMIVLKAAHSVPESTIFWHLDEAFIGKTKNFHEITIQPGIGEHRLTLVDEKGYTVNRKFRVIGEETL